jgi:glycosyltransferase involved in cell wall biosynthesis
MSQRESLEASKRSLLLTRLELSRLLQHLGKTPWTHLSNEAYRNCSEPNITIIITLFNYAEHIQECLDSVSQSNLSNLANGFDVLVIDDGSIDDSAKLVEQYIQRARIPICLVKKFFNTGLADARNVGLQLARSPFVFILDADNWIYPNCLSVLYKVINGSRYAAVYGIISCFDNYTRQSIGLMSFYEWDVRELISMPYIDAMALFKKDILLQVGGYSTELMEVGWCGWEDYDLWLKLAQHGYDCKLVPNILSAYRVHGNSMIKTTNAYTPVLAEYFKKKFTRLVEKYSNLSQLFGFPHDIEPTFK